MAEQVQAPGCGHWTTKNPDGSVPLRCGYCFLTGARRIRQRKRKGTYRVPPSIMKVLIEAPKKMLRDGPKILAEYRRQQELRQKEGE
jgi:hypothetical protein